jgi:hypothetical protein
MTTCAALAGASPAKTSGGSSTSNAISRVQLPGWESASPPLFVALGGSGYTVTQSASSGHSTARTRLVAAGTSVNIHTNRDALDTTTAAPKNPGDLDQVGSASSTEVAASGQEVDVFYNDGVNWPAGNGSATQDCLAGYTSLFG